MKIRKEFLIFGGVIVAFVLGLVIVRLIDGAGRKTYNRDDVVLDFNQQVQGYTPEAEPNEADIIDELGDFTGEQETGVGFSDDQPVAPEDGSSPGVDGAVTVDDGLGAKPEDPFDPNAVPVEVEGGEGEPVVGDEGQAEGGPVDSNETVDVEGAPSVLSMEQYGYMLTYYVCGLEDEAFERWLTPEFLSQFNTHLDEEPYKSLNGNTSFSEVKLASKVLSFKDANGTQWKFNVEFDGDRVSSVTYVK